MKPAPPTDRRADFPHLRDLQTRWHDNDVYGHVNNVVYYSFFDTVINEWLIAEGGLDPATSAVVGFCVESSCRYLAPLSYPQRLDAGLRVAHLGSSSVRYEIGIFARGEEEAAAEGWFVHVFVDRTTRRPAALPDRLRAALGHILVP